MPSKRVLAARKRARSSLRKFRCARCGSRIGSSHRGVLWVAGRFWHLACWVGKYVTQVIWNATDMAL
jgi:hypothetical protein